MSAQFVEDTKNPHVVVEVVDPISKKATAFSDDSGVNDYLAKFLDMSNNAKDNENKEKQMSLLEGLRTFPKAAMWSIILSSAIIMEGYDTSLIGSFYAFPSFKEKYGTYYSDIGEYQIPAKWQTALSMTTNVGEILGLFAAGIIADRIGFRKTLIGALLLVIGLIFIVFFSVDIGMLVAGELLMGIPWGAFQTLTVSYASEVCPMVLRIYLTTYVNICWVIGQLISSCVMKGLDSSSIKDEFKYKIPFAIQWFWPIPIIIGIYLAPESPWWLVKKGKMKEAKGSLMRLLSENKDSPDKSILAEGMIQKMQMTIKEEDTINSSSTYLDCFKGNNFRRTRIACVVWIVQICTGVVLGGAYFFEQAGLSTSMSFTLTIISYALGLLGTILSWFVSQKLGRFTIYITGLSIQCLILFIVGGLSFIKSSSGSWAIGGLLMVFTCIYDAGIGPICYCLVSELPSSRLRTKTIIVARNCYNVASIIVGIVYPYMTNPSAWNWQGKAGFLWGSIALLAVIWSYFELPETKGRTFAELDVLFAKGISARKFKTTEVEVFNAGELLEKIGEDGVKELVIENEEVGFVDEKV